MGKGFVMGKWIRRDTRTLSRLRSRTSTLIQRIGRRLS